MEKRRIFNIFRKFHGSGAWAANLLNVPRPTISMWLRGKKTSRRLDQEMPQLAQRLIETDGKCMQVNGPSARSAIGRLRGAIKRRKR